MCSPVQKLIQKWIKELHIKPETINCVQENTGAILMDLGGREHFMHLTPKAREVKAKIKEWDYFQLKSFWPAKETSNKTKKAPDGMGGDICKQWLQNGVNIQNTWRTHTTQPQTNDPIVLKHGHVSHFTFHCDICIVVAKRLASAREPGSAGYSFPWKRIPVCGQSLC